MSTTLSMGNRYGIGIWLTVGLVVITTLGLATLTGASAAAKAKRGKPVSKKPMTPATLNLLPRWKTGDKRTLELIKGLEEYEGGKFTKGGRSRTLVDVSVLESSKTGYVLQWTLGEPRFDDPELADVVSENPLMNRLLAEVKGQKLLIELDQSGSIVSLRNWRELKAYLEKTTKTIWEVFKQSRDVDASQEEKRLEEALAMFDTEENIASIFLEEPSWYFFPFGIECNLSKPIEYEDLAPNLLGGEPFTTRGYVLLKEQDAKAGRAVIEMKQSADPKEARRIMQETLTELARRMGGPRPKPGEVSTMMFDKSGQFIVDLKAGWLKSVHTQHSVRMGAMRQVQTLTIIDRTGFTAEARGLFEAGEAKLKKGQWDDAISDYTRSIAIYPYYMLAYSGRGEAKRKKGDPSGALADLTKAIELDPLYAPAYEARAEAKQMKGNGAGAIADLAKARELAHITAETYCARGTAKSAKGDADGAIADYNKAIELDPKISRAYSARGHAKFHKKDIDGAIADFNKAIELDPKDAESYIDRGFARARNGDDDGAIADFNKAIELDPKSVPAYVVRGRAKAIKHDFDGSIADFNKALELDPKNVAAYSARGHAKFHKKDLDGAIADSTKAIEIDPEYLPAYLERGRTKSRRNDLDGAIADFNKAIELDPKYVPAYVVRGRAKAIKHDFDGSIADFNKALELDPKDCAACVARASAKAKKGDSEGATADYAKAIEVDPKYAPAYYDRACFFYNRHSWREALADFRKTLELEPSEDHQDYGRVRVWLVRARLGEREAATDELKAYLKQRKVHGPNEWFHKIAPFLLGEMSEVDFVKAAETKDARVTKEQQCEAQFYIGSKRLLDGDSKGAIDAFQKCIAPEVRGSYEYDSAVAELAALKKEKDK